MIRNEKVTAYAAKAEAQLYGLYGLAWNPDHPDNVLSRTAILYADVQWENHATSRFMVRPGTWYAFGRRAERIWLTSSAGPSDALFETASEEGESVLPSSPSSAMSPLEERIAMPAGNCSNQFQPNQATAPYWQPGFTAGTLFKVITVPSWARRATLTWYRPTEGGAQNNPGLQVYELDASLAMYAANGGAVAAVTGGQNMNPMWPLIASAGPLPPAYLLAYFQNPARVISGDVIVCRWAAA